MNLNEQNRKDRFIYCQILVTHNLNPICFYIHKQRYSNKTNYFTVHDTEVLWQAIWTIAPDSYVRGPGFDTWSGNILSFFLPLFPLFQEGQLSVTGKSMCTKYWSTALPRKSVVRLTDRLNMTLDVYRGPKTTMQQQQIWTITIQTEVKKKSNLFLSLKHGFLTFN